MTKDQFHNILRIMRGIDRHELVDAGVDMTDPKEWPRFMNDPYTWFIKASDADADKVWAIIERRQS